MATCLVGASQTFDAIAFVRSMIEDDSVPYSIPDSRFMQYVETVAEDFSRHLPLDVVVGNTSLTTSPFSTVANQQRYVLSAANGFSSPPMRIVSVQSSTTGLNASNDTSYFYLNPYAVAQGFLGPAAIDSPSTRVIRGQYLGELDWYGQTYFDLVRDSATGLPAIDFYPVPQGPNPIYVKYQAQHVNTGVPTAYKYVTVPEEHKRNFADLLYAQVLYEIAARLALSGSTKLGQIEIASSVKDMREMADETRWRVYGELGDNSPAALVG